LYNWKSNNKKDIELVLKEQEQNTRHEFEKRCNDIIVQFAEQVIKESFYFSK
jgi:translation initiation factor IF-2